MNAFEAYTHYVAIKSHFNSSSYDYFKYNGKSRKITVKHFEKRRDKAFFFRLVKFNDPIMMLVWNIVEDDRWIGEICINEEAIHCYRKHKKIVQGLTYHLKNELKQFDNLKQAIEAEKTHPLIIQKYLRDEVSLETLTVLCDVVRPLNYWRKQCPGDPLIDKVCHIISKYKAFMKYNRDDMKVLVKEVFNGNTD